METTDKLDVKEIEYGIYSYIMQDFEIGKDVKIHNYFRVRFPQQNLI